MTEKKKTRGWKSTLGQQQRDEERRPAVAVTGISRIWTRSHLGHKPLGYREAQDF